MASPQIAEAQQRIQAAQRTQATELDLSGLDLEAVPSIGHLQNLIALSLFSNQFTSVPPELGQLQNLTELYLIDPGDPDRKVRKISGAALRTLHEFLKRKDPDQVWGDLTRTNTPEGDVLWLCKEHIKEVYPTSS